MLNILTDPDNTALKELQTLLSGTALNVIYFSIHFFSFPELPEFNIIGADPAQLLHFAASDPGLHSFP